MGKRITELDLFRGILLVLMVIYHLYFDLHYFYDFDFFATSKILDFLQLFFAGCFIVVCGISSTLSKNNLKRGMKLLVVALLITLITYCYDSSSFVMFGIIHFLSIAIIFYHFIKDFNYKWLLGLLGICVLLTFILKNIDTYNFIFFVIGANDKVFVSLDYFPIFGNINFFIIGVLLGKLLYNNRENRFINVKGKNILVKIGQHSLLIYLLHQPIILFVLNLFNN